MLGIWRREELLLFICFHQEQINTQKGELFIIHFIFKYFRIIGYTNTTLFCFTLLLFS